MAVSTAMCGLGSARVEAAARAGSQIFAAAGKGAKGKQHTAASGGAGGASSGDASGAAAATGAKDAATAAGIATVPKPTSATAAVKSDEEDSALRALIAKLPPLTGTNIDVGKQSAAVKIHLNTVLRFYRGATVPIQKVGEPSDMLYAEQSQVEATQVATLAFQAAKYEAALLSKLPGAASAQTGTGESAGAQPQQTEAQRLNGLRTQAQERLSALQTQQATLQEQIAKAPGDQRAALMQQEQQVEGGIELQQAMVSALARMNTFSEAQTQTGLAGEIDRLQRSAPELMSQPVKTPAPRVLQSLAAARDSGVTSQATVLFQLLGALHTVEQQTATVDLLSKQATDLMTPFVSVLRSTVAQGQALTQQTLNLSATPTTNAQDLENTRQQFDTLTTTFQVLAGAMMPLEQEAVLLDNARGTLTTWRATVNAEYKEILRQLLMRVGIIALALVVLAVVNNVLSRAAVRYVSDLRRRRQLLLIRRIVIGFLTGLVLIFGFVTQFSSLATFAGFISAGIAVGLQTILLSVAAYFFIVGRYGVRVGDRITVAGVTGDVIEVGLVRFYVMELVGTGTEPHSTGRVAVFANSVLFQTGTPIYKQMPGTEYAWHELTAKLSGNADAKAVTDAITQIVNEIYGAYSVRIEAQHRDVEGWMGTALPPPKVESRLELTEGGLQLALLFPVEIDKAAAADQQIAERLVEQMRIEGPLKAGVTELPVIKAAVKS